MSRLFVVIFFLEVGLVLMLAPWSAYWDRNYFAETSTLIHAVAGNNFVRGAITGLGVVNIGAAVADLVAMFFARSVSGSLTVVESRSADK